MGTQRIITLFVSLILILGGVFYFRGKANTENILHVCTWSNYYPDESISNFTKDTGIKVQISYISSNEELFAKLKAGATGFDIIQPSDYMVRQMSALSMLNALDKNQIPNLVHLDSYYQKLNYDNGLKYTIPFTWGTSGIAINTSKVKLPAGEIGWDILLNSPDPKHTSLLDDMREVFSSVLISQGHSPNSLIESELNQAKLEITKIKDRILIFSSEPKPLMLKEELTISHIYSSDANQIQIENPAIKFFIPKEGGIIWTDNFAIPTSAVHINEAHTFINYFLDPKNALVILNQNHLATPNKTARLLLPKDVQNNENIYPSQNTLKKMFFLEDLGETLSVINRMWTELKS